MKFECLKSFGAFVRSFFLWPKCKFLPPKKCAATLKTVNNLTTKSVNPIWCAINLQKVWLEMFLNYQICHPALVCNIFAKVLAGNVFLLSCQSLDSRRVETGFLVSLTIISFECV
jgi:hypothetical protein